MSTYEFLKLKEADGIALVTLNRPPLNVLHIPMMAELNAVLETVLADANLAAFVLRPHAPPKPFTLPPQLRASLGGVADQAES